MRDAFEDHPYGKDSDGTPGERGGERPSRSLPISSARHVHKKGLVVSAVGDITARSSRVSATGLFGGLPSGDQSGDDGAEIAEAHPGDDGALVVSRTPVPQSAVSFGQAGPKRDDPDWYAAYVLNDILGGGGFRGRLMREIREKRGLAYGVSTALVPYRHAGLIFGSIATENSRVARIDRADPRGMAAHARGWPERSRVARAKAYLAGSFPLGLDSTGRIAGVLVQMQTDKLGIDYLDRRPALIGGVTLDEARRVARRLYDRPVELCRGWRPGRPRINPPIARGAALRRAARETSPHPNPPPSRGGLPEESPDRRSRPHVCLSFGECRAEASPSMGEGFGWGDAASSPANAAWTPPSIASRPSQ